MFVVRTWAILSGAVMFSLSRLARGAYVLGLSVFLCLLVRPNLSNGQQYRAVMPPMPMILPVNNAMTDTAVGGGMGGGMIGGMGGIGGMMGGMGGMGGMMGMGGGM